MSGSRGSVDWKTVLAVAGLAFGVLQFFISQRKESEKQRLEQELQEQRDYAVGVHHLKFTDAELGNLIRRLQGQADRAGAPPEALKGSLLLLKRDNQADGEGRRGGWPGMIAVHIRAAADRPEQRDQEYRFLKLTNTGQRPLNRLQITFDTGEDATIAGFGPGSAILIPLEVVGLHANLTRTQRRTPLEAFYEFPSAGQRKREPFDVAFHGDWYTTDSPGVWQALPEFAQPPG